MPWGLKRFQASGQTHFVTFCCYHRRLLFAAPVPRQVFEAGLERVRRSSELCVYGYVVMPEHVHLLLSEPRKGTLADAIKSLKQGVSRRLIGGAEHFWQKRYYDFNVRKRTSVCGKAAIYSSEPGGARRVFGRGRTGSGAVIASTRRVAQGRCRLNASGRRGSEEGRKGNSVQPSNCPTQAKKRLEWATRREYSPTQGRWLTPDPGGLAVIDPTNPQSWNRYAYANNDPVSFSDPSGLIALPCYPDCGDDGGGDSGGGIDPCFFSSFFCGGGPPQPPIVPPIRPGGGGGGKPTCGIVPLRPCKAANNDPQTGVPANPCASAGGAPNPSVYAAAGTIAQVSEFLSPGGLLVNAAYLFSFRSGGALDAQPLGGSRAYGNYVFGAYLGAAGIPLSVGLDGANGYASVKNAQYPGFTMDPNYPAIPQANVANIVNGYNAQQNSTLCHK